MDIQLFATDEELREFPESKIDSNTVLDKTPSPNDINLTASDLPRSHTDLPKIPSSLPDHKSKRKSRRSHRHKSRSKNSIVGHPVIQANDPLYSIREKQWVVQMTHAQTTHAAYLDQLVERPAGPPPEAIFPVVGQPMVSQPGCPIPLLLSLCLQPDLNVLARTLSPQALRYVHLGIQISRSLLN